MEYHVSINGNDNAAGTAQAPFRTISRAAELATAGDTVTVHAGVYREWVSPKNSGTADAPITYQSAGDGEVVITGAERLTGWKNEGGHVWSAEVDNAIFTIRNPFAEELYGDWLFEGAFKVHLGDIYLDGKSLYESDALEKIREPKAWPQAKYKDESLLQWYGEVNDTITKLWANFGGVDPNAANIEISVRPYCFWPAETGRNYITVRGFTLCQASPQWAPPTALQEGLIGPHWSKGWVIENNIIRESKCVGVSLGKSIDTGHNEWSRMKIKGGTQREQEVIFRAVRGNWNKENIGGHTVRGNTIHDCEQAGIVGHLGCAFSVIEDNRIFRIHHKRLFHGAEVGGIKLHAALDTQIRHNKIYSCYRALWLDWQAQGTVISKNVFFDSLSEDFFMEVCHGPYLVENNVFLSPMNFRNMAQGGAFVHNLFAGKFVVRHEVTRYTPYHFPHETAVAGYANITGGDDRYYNNIFLRDGDENDAPVPMTFFEHLPLPPRTTQVGGDGPIIDGVPDSSICYLFPVGLGGYNDHPNAKDKPWWEWTREEMKAQREKGKAIRFGEMPLPVAMGGNLYLDAVPCEHEEGFTRCEESGLSFEVDAGAGKVIVEIKNPQVLRDAVAEKVTSQKLGKAHHAEMGFVNPDGSDYDFGNDFLGRARGGENVVPGPFEVGAGMVFEIK